MNGITLLLWSTAFALFSQYIANPLLIQWVTR